MLARKWAWEALLASDDTEPETVLAIEAALAGLTERQPALQARAQLHWLRQVTHGSLDLGTPQIDALEGLAALVEVHRRGRVTFDDYVVPGALDPDLGLAVRVRTSSIGCGTVCISVELRTGRTALLRQQQAANAQLADQSRHRFELSYKVSDLCGPS